MSPFFFRVDKKINSGLVIIVRDTYDWDGTASLDQLFGELVKEFSFSTLSCPLGCSLAKWAILMWVVSPLCDEVGLWCPWHSTAYHTAWGQDQGSQVPESHCLFSWRFYSRFLSLRKPITPSLLPIQILGNSTSIFWPYHLIFQFPTWPVLLYLSVGWGQASEHTWLWKLMAIATVSPGV